MFQKGRKENYEPLFKQVEDSYPEGVIFSRTDSRKQQYFFMIYHGKKIRRKTREELEEMKKALAASGEWSPRRGK